jgi:hypothetical protein
VKPHILMQVARCLSQPRPSVPGWVLISRSLSSSYFTEGPLVEYHRKVGRGEIHSDPHQVKAVQLLQNLHASIVNNADMAYVGVLCV